MITAPDRPVGRAQLPTPTPVGAAARALGLAPLTPARVRSPESVRAVELLAPGIGILADYGQIIPAALLELPPYGIINVHPSLLPRHRGASPIPATILAGDPEAGVTLIRMDAGLDTGPIIASRAWPLSGAEVAPELEERAAEEASRLLRSVLGPWLRGELQARPQGGDQVTLTRPLHREDGRLDPSRGVVELERQVRAYQPWPGSFLEWPGGRLIVWRARAEGRPLGGARVPVAPGDLAGVGPRELALVVSDGLLLLDEVQPSGGGRMGGDAFRRGHPGLPQVAADR